MAANDEQVQMSVADDDRPEGLTLEDGGEAAQDDKQAAAEQGKSDSWWKDTRIWVNVLGYISVTAALILIQVRPDFLPNMERGYGCDDPALQLPKKPDSIKLKTLIISSVCIFLISVFISEGVYSITPEYQTSKDVYEDATPAREKVLLFINLVTSKLLYGYLGLILTMNLTYLLQHMTSCYRPDFIAVCEPDVSHCSINPLGFLVHCQQTNKEQLADSRMSFPSEYASISFFIVIFSSMIIERAVSGEFFAMKLAVQSFYIFWAIYATCSRIKDNKSHPIDCIFGFLLGTSVALYMDNLATYADYDGGYYDPSNLTFNIRDWEEGAEMQGDERGETMPQDYPIQ